MPLAPIDRLGYPISMSIPEHLDDLIVRLSDDPKALKLLGHVVEKQQEYKRAIQHLRDHLGGERPAAAKDQTAKPRRAIGVIDPGSISQRCLKAVIDAGGKNISTEKVAEQVGVTVLQVRGSLKRFVNEKVISKPRRGVWRYEVGRLNGHVNNELPVEK